MASLDQLKSAKSGDYIEVYWPEMNNAYFKVYKNSKNHLRLSGLFLYGSKPSGRKSFKIKDLYNNFKDLSIIHANSKKAIDLESKFAA